MQAYTVPIKETGNQSRHNYQETARGGGAPAGVGARATVRRVPGSGGRGGRRAPTSGKYGGVTARADLRGGWPAVATGTTPRDSRDEAVCVLSAALDLGFPRLALRVRDTPRPAGTYG